MAELYGVEEGGAPECINVFISNMRSRLIAAGAPWQTIETIPGRGYRLSQFDPSENYLQPACDTLLNQVGLGTPHSQVA